MNNIRYFATSDTHFGHSNILKHCKRPFADINEHDYSLIHNWNSIVGKNDTVYHLGDIAFYPKEKLIWLLSKLNGKIIVIKGNHDQVAAQNRSLFHQFHDARLFTKVHGKEFVLDHYAMRVWPKSHHGVYHLYGHSHGTLPEDPFSLSFDIGVDCFEYKPVDFKKIIELMEAKQKKIEHNKNLSEHGVYS